MTCFRPRVPSPLLLGAAVALLLLAHAACFTSYVRRDIAGAYPPNFDQTTSLWLAYRTYEEGRAGRTLPAVGFVLLRAPNGAAIVMEAVRLFAVVGPSRLAALFVNRLHFAL